MWVDDSHPPETSDFEAWYRTSPLPLYEVTASNLPEPRWVGDALRKNGQTRSLGLAYGHPLRDSCLVQVISALPRDASRPIELILAEHRDRSLGPVTGIETKAGEVTIDEQRMPTEFTASSEVWVAESRLPGVTVTVVATRWEPEGDWRLVRLGDVGQFIEGRRSLPGGG